MAKSLTFADNRREYDLNGKITVRFNPTDEGFVSRLRDTFEKLDALQELLSSGDMFERFGELDMDMRARIDALLGDGVSEALFEDMNCYALADGMPVWANLVLAILDEVAEAYEDEFGKTDARVKSHTDKYDALMRKYRRGT